jgi:hypothetical protein
MQTLYGFTVYSPNGGHGRNPADWYSLRAGSNASIVPVSRLTR